jgi:16S rRNA (cytosine1402-N4)-methyltransferase
MVSEVLDLLPAEVELVADLTVGGGGHAEAILRQVGGHVELIAFDRDVAALETAANRLRPLPNQIEFICDSYARIDAHLSEAYHGKFDFVLLDLGLSSLQLAAEGRGFSFTNLDDPLDLRFDISGGETLANKVAHVSSKDLTAVLRDYGELRNAKAVAAQIITSRQHGKLCTVGDLVAALERFARPGHRHRFLAQVWQALRIWVNDELEQLRSGLIALPKYLRPDGVLVVISFHSLEDRMVKEFFVKQENPCICPPRAPQCACGRKPTMKRLARKPRRPTDREVAANPRSRSARLRAARRLLDS